MCEKTPQTSQTSMVAWPVGSLYPLQMGVSWDITVLMPTVESSSGTWQGVRFCRCTLSVQPVLLEQFVSVEDLVNAPDVVPCVPVQAAVP